MLDNVTVEWLNRFSDLDLTDTPTIGNGVQPVLYELRKLVDANRLEITTNDSKDPRTEYRLTGPTEPNS